MIRRRDNMPDSMDDLLHDLNNAAYRYYKFADHYGCKEAAQIANGIVDICTKHGLYEERF